MNFTSLKRVVFGFPSINTISLKGVMKPINYTFLLLIVCLCGGQCEGPVPPEPPYNPPSITEITPDSDTVVVGGTITITCMANDPDGQSFSYDWKSMVGTYIDSGASIEWTAPD